MNASFEVFFLSRLKRGPFICYHVKTSPVEDSDTMGMKQATSHRLYKIWSCICNWCTLYLIRGVHWRSASNSLLHNNCDKEVSCNAWDMQVNRYSRIQSFCTLANSFPPLPGKKVRGNLTLISQANFHTPRWFEKSGFHCTCIELLMLMLYCSPTS